MENEKFSVVPSLKFLFKAGKREEQKSFISPLSTIRISGFSHNVDEFGLVLVDELMFANVVVLYDGKKKESKGEDPWMTPIDIMRIKDEMVEAFINPNEQPRKLLLTPANRITLSLFYTGVMPRGLKRDNSFLVSINLKYETDEEEMPLLPSL